METRRHQCVLEEVRRVVHFGRSFSIERLTTKAQRHKRLIENNFIVSSCLRGWSLTGVAIHSRQDVQHAREFDPTFATRGSERSGPQGQRRQAASGRVPTLKTKLSRRATA